MRFNDKIYALNYINQPRSHTGPEPHTNLRSGPEPDPVVVGYSAGRQEAGVLIDDNPHLDDNNNGCFDDPTWPGVVYHKLIVLRPFDLPRLIRPLGY